MENIDIVIDLIDLLALPLVVFFLLLLFFFFIVRPFFAFLFNKERLDALAAIREAEKKRKQEAGMEAAAEGEEESDRGDQGVSFQKKSIREDQRTIGRIAESDPAKAGELVKRWLRKDQE